jgi:hypothetical protein
MHRLFEKMIPQATTDHAIPRDAAPDAAETFRYYMSDYHVLMQYWYSALFVVVEGFRDDLKLHDPKIDALLQSPYAEDLKYMRHATFHYQKHFVSPKMLRILASTDSVPWVWSLHQAFDEFFLREVPKA